MITASGSTTHHRVKRIRCSSQNTASSAIAVTSGTTLMLLVYATAITMMAPMSSATASVSRNARSAAGRNRPVTASTARAKAMSVAHGMAQPRAAGCPALTAR